MAEFDADVPVFYFTAVKNVGDQMNTYLIARLFGRRAVLSPLDTPHVLAIGSLIGAANSHSRIWGTGVLHPSGPIADVSPPQIRALRGKLSHDVFRSRGIKLGDIPLGDPGFLISRCFEASRYSKKWKLGVAAHYVDRSHPWLSRFLRRADVVDLDVHADPEVFLSTLAQCEAVVSSSLHGLVFAEALGVPNCWIRLSDKVHGDGFKFRDWFSLSEAPQSRPEIPGDQDTVESLARRATLHGMQIDEDAMIASFPLEIVLSSSSPVQTQ